MNDFPSSTPPTPTLLGDSFPTQGLLPKIETQAAEFLKKYPNYDGTNVTIAILDTGVDPGAAGLQTTTQGLPKVIDLVDCTNSGDVQLYPTQLISENTLIGLSGKTLTLNPSWKNPSNQWKVGIKKAFDLFPAPLVNRLKKSQKTRFMIEHSNLVTSAQNQLLSTENKDEIKARLDCLKDLAKSYDDPGLVYDIVAWNDGKDWRCVIDTLQTGDLSQQPPLTDYRKELKYHTFGKEDLLNFAVNFYDNLLSIVTLAGSHGTHVAGIAAAHYPNDPDMNGVAPGAQIISLKIGDSRLGSMETGSGLIRAAIHMALHKPQVANMSYGEATSHANLGRFSELLRDEVINKSGVVFVSSAGNAGPGLSTVGAPGGTTSGVIGVGAYVNDSMMIAEYSLLDRVPPRPFTWSSRGPTNDGDVGVSIYAPGAAITAVPTYTLQPNQQMNGTSMASPNACGCIALLISGLLQEKIPYSPYTIKHAVENSSDPVDSDLHKTGFIQVVKAWDWLTSLNSSTDNKDGKWDILYDITLNDLPLAPRGIYLRDPLSTNRISQSNVTVTPHFYRQDDPDTNPLKLGLDLRIRLTPTVPWVSAPEFAAINNGGKTFAVRVDPTSLEPGLVHVAYIDGMDSTSNQSLGPLFRIPITVCKPIISEPKLSFKEVKFGPGHIHRRFIAVPQGATMLDVTLTSKGRPTPARFMMQLLQSLPQTRNSKIEQDYSFLLGSASVDKGATVTKTLRVVGGVTLELCLAQFWSSASDTILDIDLDFHGVQVTSNPANGSGQVGVLGMGASMYGGIVLDTITRLDLYAPVQRETLTPSISLDTLRKTILPSTNEIRPLGSRDILPDSRTCFALNLTWDFKVTEATTVTLRLPWIDDLLYESPFEHFLLLIFDANKRLVSTRDVYPKGIKLEKGEYQCRGHLVGSTVDILEKWTSAPLYVDTKIKEMSLSTYASMQDVYAGRSGFGEKTLQLGERRALYLGPVEFPKDANVGDVLFGEVKMFPKVDGGQGLVMIPVTASKDVKDKSTNQDKPLAEAIRDLEISHVSKLKGEEQEKLLEKLSIEHPNHLPLLMVKMELALAEANSKKVKEQVSEEEPSPEEVNPEEEAPGGDEVPETSDQPPETPAQEPIPQSNAPTQGWSKVLEMAEQVIQAAQGSDLVLFYASKDADSKKKKEMEVRKSSLLAALYNKMDALRRLGVSSQDYEKAWEEYQRWIWLDSAASNEWKQVRNQVYHDQMLGKPGQALKTVLKYLNDPAMGDASKGFVKRANKAKIRLLKRLGWSCWVDYSNRQTLVKFPTHHELP